LICLNGIFGTMEHQAATRGFGAQQCHATTRRRGVGEIAELVEEFTCRAACSTARNSRFY
jgi:hypothetical protein